MSWPPSLDELKVELSITDTRDDARLQTVLDAAIAFVERVRSDVAFPGIPDVGDSVNLTLVAADDEGDPSNFDTITLTVTLPDGTVDDSPVVDNPPDVSGRYVVSFTPEDEGGYTATWTTTGPVSVVNEYFTVRTPGHRRAPTADLQLGTLRLAGRWHTRRRSPDGLVSLAELGAARVPSFDPDIERLLRIGRFRMPVIA